VVVIGSGSGFGRSGYRVSGVVAVVYAFAEVDTDTMVTVPVVQTLTEVNAEV
jgi:hypothetical protein